ncbi:MAG: SDR family oxidoreductase [Phycisphaerales bacterium]|nr:SDR family oxidoreductase [Phycisphaerales bacterium]
MSTIFGKRALVTGGSRGIGLAYAEALSAQGCSVVINHFKDGAKASAECRRLTNMAPCYEIDADVGEPAAAREMVQRAASLLGGLDIVISNAGICRFTPFLEISEEIWSRHVEVNLSGAFRVSQEAAWLMVAAGGGGRIVMTTSVGAFRSNSGQTHYCSTKGGLNLLMQGMALELAPHQITVNAIAPGWIHTDINDAASRDSDAVASWLKAHCPAGRLGRPDDVKEALLFLVSRDASYVTGSTLSVDGGWNAQL